MMPRSRHRHRTSSSSPSSLHSTTSFHLHRCYSSLLLSIQLVVLILCCSVNTAISANSEATALLNWVTSNNNNNLFSNWKPEDPTPCNWTYIRCSPALTVTEITIQSVQLAAVIPSSLPKSLPYLEKLVVSSANLTGTIPTTISNLRSLTVLDLSFNSLVGPIPPLLFTLPKLCFVDLSSNELTGPIPPQLSGAISLKELHLFDNHLSGGIPVSIGNLTSIEIVRLGGNRELGGPIPDEISNCGNLTVLGLAYTKISGSIPASFEKLKNLETLSIYSAMISGEIPPEIGECSNLVNLFLYENMLSGSLPKELGNLDKLEKLLLWQNELTGPLPDEIGNCTSLQMIDLSINAISGGIPQSFGRFTNLQELMLSDNNISGSIPPFFSHLSALSQLQLDNNQISGLIPPEIGLLKNLVVFLAWENQLEGSIPHSLASCSQLQSLDLSHNHLTGSIPPGIFLITNLTKLLLLGNDISGTIPPEIGHSRSLIRLRLGSNRIGGTVPKEISGLTSLNFLDLSNNRLIGPLPEEMGNCSKLQMLDVSNNGLSGGIPESLSTITGLQSLDGSRNQFTGSIPESFGKLVSLNKLVLSGNKLSGSIPVSIGQCYSLQLLDLSANSLTGVVPPEICRIEGLEIALNLSINGLEGPIPPKISSLNKLSVLDISYNKMDGNLSPLANLENLVALNVSHNNFTGYLPDTNLFRKLSASDLEGNQWLCTRGGDVCFVNVNSRPITEEETRRLHRLKLLIVLLITMTVAMLLGMLGVVRAKRTSVKKCDSDGEMGGEMSWPWQFTPFQKLSFSVEQVVRSLVDANIIGKGCSGVVYRVDMDNGEAIAVKKLWPTTTSSIGKNDGGRDSFSAEVRTLGSIRHKNIVRFLGCCWNKRTRLLMYDYMENGSLGAVLHERNEIALQWDLRYQIILGAAQGLSYLHHDCVPPIVHRDIKANNILIGLDFEPCIADFGLAKLVEDGEFGKSSNTVVAGSYGYIAPEYGYKLKITEKSDVYSFGVVMLEVLTGKQPIDPLVPDGLALVDWVRRRKGCSDVLDPNLRCRPESEIEEILQALGVALLCTNPIPEDRPTMKDVAAMLKEIRHEREEYSKVDVLLHKGCSPPSSSHEAAAATGLPTCSNPRMACLDSSTCSSKAKTLPASVLPTVARSSASNQFLRQTDASTDSSDNMLLLSVITLFPVLNVDLDATVDA